MNILSQKHLKFSTLALAGAMSTTLILGGCGDKDKPKNAEIKKIEKVATRKVDNAEAERALTALSLNEPGSGALSWAKRTGDSGNYTYTDVVVKSGKDADIKIAKMELLGAHMQGEQASFDKIQFQNFTVVGEDDKGDLSFGTVSLVKPSPALAAGMVDLFAGNKDAFDNIDGDIGFQALSFTDMKASSDDSNFSVKSMSMGEAKDKTGVFSIANLKLDVKPGDDDNDNSDDKGFVKMTLGGFDVTGANLKKYKGLMTETMAGGKGANADALANIISSMNVYDPDFKSINLRDLDIDADGLKVALKSYQASADKKNGIVTMSQKMSPLSIIPPKDGRLLGQKKMSKVLSSMGYDRFEFTMGGKSIMNEEADTLKAYDNYIEMRDGFRFSYDMDIKGYKAFTEQAVAAQAGGSMKNPMVAMGMANALQINKMRFAFRDDSIVDRYFKMTAEEQKTTPEALKQKIKDTLGMMSMGAQDESQQKLANELQEAVTSFLDGGGTLVLDISPAEPLNPGSFAMGAMMGGAPDIAALGITISHQ